MHLATVAVHISTVNHADLPTDDRGEVDMEEINVALTDAFDEVLDYMSDDFKRVVKRHLLVDVDVFVEVVRQP